MEPAWRWDEYRQVGTDYESLEEVRLYDERMGAFRNVRAESQRILKLLGVRGEDTVLEIGTGTGAFARAAARACRQVVAVDVSPVMLEYAKERAADEGLGNIAFHRAGFLTFAHDGEPVDAVVSQLALHHLPDYWKSVALRRVAAALRPGGRFYLADVVFADEADRDPAGYFDRLVRSLPESTRPEMELHIREEFSTLDWLLRGLLERAGFAIEKSDSGRRFIAWYLCRAAGGESSG